MNQHLASSGRGGAGNFVDSSKSPQLGPKDLETPTLKTSMVTTGRGGTGNMAKNKDPAETRALQDVEAVPRRPSGGTTLVGRGGTGNIFKPGSEEAEAAKKARDDSALVADEPPAAAAVAAATATATATASPGPGEKPAPAKGKHWFMGKKG